MGQHLGPGALGAGLLRRIAGVASLRWVWEPWVLAWYDGVLVRSAGPGSLGCGPGTLECWFAPLGLGALYADLDCRFASLQY